MLSNTCRLSSPALCFSKWAPALGKRFLSDASKAGTTQNGVRVVAEGPVGAHCHIAVYVEGGSSSENFHTQGIHHHLQHLAWQNSTKRSALRLQRQLALLGGHMQVDVHREAFKVSTTVLSNDVQYALDLISGAVMPRIAEFEVRDITAGVAADVQRYNSDNAHRFKDAYYARAFGYRGLGNDEHSSADAVGQFSVEELKDFVDQQFVAGNIVVAGVGIDQGTLQEAASYAFEGVEGQRQPVPKSVYTGGSANIPVRTDTHVAVLYEGAPFLQGNHAALTVAAHILGAGSRQRSLPGFNPGTGAGSRLATNIVGKHAFVHRAKALNRSYGDSGLFGVVAVASPGNAPELANALRQEIAALKNVTDEEVASAAAQAAMQQSSQLSSGNAALDFVGYQGVYNRNPISTSAYIGQLRAVKKADVLAAVNALLSANPTVVGLGDVAGL